MTANNKRARETTTVAVRIPLVRRRQLELIQVERGHDDLSDALREAFSEYIDRYLRADKRAA